MAEKQKILFATFDELLNAFIVEVSKECEILEEDIKNTIIPKAYQKPGKCIAKKKSEGNPECGEAVSEKSKTGKYCFRHYKANEENKDDKAICKAKTQKQERCKNAVSSESLTGKYCKRHIDQDKKEFNKEKASSSDEDDDGDKPSKKSIKKSDDEEKPSKKTTKKSKKSDDEEKPSKKSDDEKPNKKSSKKSDDEKPNKKSSKKSDDEKEDSKPDKTKKSVTARLSKYKNVDAMDKPHRVIAFGDMSVVLNDNKKLCGKEKIVSEENKTCKIVPLLTDDMIEIQTQHPEISDDQFAI